MYVFVVVKVICQSGSQFRWVTSDPTLSPGLPRSTRGTCTASRSASTSAPPFDPRWVCTASWSPWRRVRTGGAMKWARLCCSVTPGWKVGARRRLCCHNFLLSEIFCFHGRHIHISDDPVYMPLNAQREEYIRSDYGLVYMGSRQNVSWRPWSFGQVGDTIFTTGANAPHVISQRQTELCLSQILTELRVFTKASFMFLGYFHSTSRGSLRRAWSCCRSAHSTWVTRTRTTSSERILSTSPGWSVRWWGSAEFEWTNQRPLRSKRRELSCRAYFALWILSWCQLPESDS